MFLQGFRNHYLPHTLKSFFCAKLIFQRPKCCSITALSCVSLHVSLMAGIKPPCYSWSVFVVSEWLRDAEGVERIVSVAMESYGNANHLQLI